MWSHSCTPTFGPKLTVLHVPGCIYFKICLDSLNPYTPILFTSTHSSKSALWLGCNQTINRKQVRSPPQAGFFFFFLVKSWAAMWTQSDLWECCHLFHILALLDDKISWLVTAKGDQQRQLQDHEEMSQHPRDINYGWEKGSLMIKTWGVWRLCEGW